MGKLTDVCKDQVEKHGCRVDDMDYYPKATTISEKVEHDILLTAVQKLLLVSTWK